MSLCITIANLCTATWIWGITYGRYFISVNIIMLFLLLKLWVKLPALKAVIYSLIAHLFSFVAFTVTVYAIELIRSSCMYDLFSSNEYAFLSLVIIHSTFQMILFLIMALRYPLL